ncbi:hypothetical protein FNH13_15295 [Ornithinimicrobium ciconiae]|uniref:Uncharacterized protein n=1 Tax=Ornithinimicrobium ciconiae TaxID=2594265 RepID=A0A516GDE2_9MICO|nr:hypothetical protein [Ornithinimicrobium ciconiae]QDO89531.1 hypothetical protein FNH13_15295 [Ornithinimicrobium ciconiae]
MAFLLDHEYSRRGLSAGKLKGEDARRAGLLIAAAKAADCEAILAQTEIQETWEAGFDSYESWAGGYDDEDEDDYDEPDQDVHDVTSLLDNSVALTWWADPGNTGEVTLPLGGDEVVAVTPSNDLTPYASEFEGYMGNYGNTVDRWYRRAALVIWPSHQGFAVRAEASPGWALEAILASLAKGEQERARREADGLASAWGRTAPAALLTPALLVAAGIEDGERALAVLSPFDVHMLDVEHAAQLAELAMIYPSQWWTALRAQLDGGFRLIREDRRTWVETHLRAVCRELASVDGRQVVSWLGLWMSEWAVAAVDSALQDRRVAQRDKDLDLLGPAVAAVLAVVDQQRGTAVVGHLKAAGDRVLPLLVSAVRSHEPPSNTAMRALFTHLHDLLTEVLARPQRESDDWSIPWTSTGGEDADKLARFLASATQRTLEWPLAAPRRQSVHHWIDEATLPVRHLTRRRGRPYTLVLTKTDELFSREQAARHRAGKSRHSSPAYRERCPPGVSMHRSRVSVTAGGRCHAGVPE